MDNELKKCAEILVSYGYAVLNGSKRHWRSPDKRLWVLTQKKGHLEPIEPFSDTIEGIHQAHAIENWFHRNHQALLIKCKDSVPNASLSEYDGHQKRLERLKWCIKNYK